MALRGAADVKGVDRGVGLKHRHLLDDKGLHLLVRVRRLRVDRFDHLAVLWRMSQDKIAFDTILVCHLSEWMREPTMRHVPE